MWRCRRSLPVNAAHRLDDSGLVLGEAVGSSHSTVGKVVSSSSYSTPSTTTVPRFVVDQVQKVAVVQAERGVLGDKRRLHLELDNGHGLLDLLGEARLGLESRIALEGEGGAGVVRVGVGGEGGWPRGAG